MQPPCVCFVTYPIAGVMLISLMTLGNHFRWGKADQVSAGPAVSSKAKALAKGLRLEVLSSASVRQESPIGGGEKVGGRGLQRAIPSPQINAKDRRDMMLGGSKEDPFRLLGKRRKPANGDARTASSEHQELSKSAP